jgi:hypothetical protein
MPRISVIPNYKNDPPPEAVTELVQLLAKAEPSFDVVAQAPIEPRGHEATFWQIVSIVYHEVANASSIAGAVALAKEYLKRRHAADNVRRPKSVRILGPGNKEITSVVLDEEDGEPREERDEDTTTSRREENTLDAPDREA